MCSSLFYMLDECGATLGMSLTKLCHYWLFQAFLLEKSKVVRQSEEESTFKIFHYLVSGCDPKLR